MQQHGHEPDHWVSLIPQVKRNAQQSLDHVSLFFNAVVGLGNPNRCYQAEAENIHLVAHVNKLSLVNAAILPQQPSGLGPGSTTGWDP